MSMDNSRFVELDERFVKLFYSLFLTGYYGCKGAINDLEANMEEYGDMGMEDTIDAIREDFERLEDYWLRDVKDPCLDKMVNKITVRIANAISEYSSRLLNQEDSCYLLTLKREAGRKGDLWQWSDIRRKLESFISDEALAGLDFDGQGRERLYRIIDEHYEYSKRLFNHLATMGLLGGNDADDIIDLLSSPTVDSSDQQLIVSALTLSGSRAFDINKYRIMAHVCRSGANMMVRQRALVGFVLTQGYCMYKIFPEQKEIFDEVMADDDIASQLVELQMQMVFCMKAMGDSEVLENEIMPEMLKNSPVRIKDGKFEEMDESMDDILGTNDIEKRTEEVERLMGRLHGMQNSGADIFFKGFSHMKRFPFFNDMVNWFLPFSTSHRSMREVVDMLGGDDFFRMLFSKTSFCDSDRYSFVLALQHVFRQMPAEVFEQLKTSSRCDDMQDVVDTPTLYRRNYLQGLYRFFKLFKWRNGYFSPFVLIHQDGEVFCNSEENISYIPYYLFASNPLFLESEWLKKNLPRLLLFFCKNELEFFYEDLYVEWPLIDTFEGNMAMAKYLDKIHHCYSGKVLPYYKRALELNPQSVVAKKMVAYKSMETEPEQAKRLLFELLESDADNVKLNYNAAKVCYDLGDYKSGLPLLYKLEYMYPDDLKIKYLFGATLVLNGNFDKACAVFDKVDDYENMGDVCPLCVVAAYWLATRSVAKTIEAVNGKGIVIDNYDLSSEEIKRYINLLLDNGISHAEYNLMCDCLS